MDKSTVFTKTAKGITQVNQKSASLSKDLMKVLKLIDGKSNVGQLGEKAELDKMQLEKALNTLAKDGFARIFQTKKEEADPFGEDDFDFTAPGKMSPASTQRVIPGAANDISELVRQQEKADADRKAKEQAHADARTKAKSEAEGRARAEAEARARQQAEMQAMEQAKRAKEAAERAKAELESKMREEETRRQSLAAQQAKLSTEQKAKEEEESRRLAELRVKAEREAKALAEARARAEAEAAAMAKARAEAEAAAKRKAAEANAAEHQMKERLKEEIEARIRNEMEELLRNQAQEKAREDAQAAAQVQQKSKEEQARSLEEEHRAREEMRAQIMAEARLAAKAELEERLREEREAIARAESEARSKAETDAQARAEEESRKRAEAEKRAAAEAEARLKAEEEARRLRVQAEEQGRRAKEMEARARAEAEARAREQSEVAAKLEAERQGKYEAEARAKIEAEERDKRERELSATIDAERKAKEEAEMRARIEARARETIAEDTRAKVQAEIEGDMTKRAEIEGKAQARAYMEAKTRAEEEADEKIRAEQARKAREIAEVLRTRVESDADAPEAPTRKKRRPSRRGSPLRAILFGLVAFMIVAIGALHLVPLRPYTVKVERTLSTWLNDDVSIASMTFRLVPTPHLRLENISVGKSLDAKADTGRVYLDLGTLFGDKLAINAIELENVRISNEAARRIPLWAQPQGKAESGGISKITLRGVTVDVKPKIESFTAVLDYAKDGTLKQAMVSAGAANFNLKPKDAGYEFDASARQWTLPVGAPIPVSDVRMKGTWTGNEIVVPEFEADALEGKVNGTLHVTWGPTVKLESDLSLAKVSTAALVGSFTKSIAVNGRMDGNFSIAAEGPSLEQLFAAPRVQGKFRLGEGSISNVDLVAVMQSDTAAGRAGVTKFAELSGEMSAAGSTSAYRNLSLQGGVLRGNGVVDVGTNGNLSGHLNLEIRSQVAQDRGTFAVTGTVQRPIVKRGG